MLKKYIAISIVTLLTSACTTYENSSKSNNIVEVKNSYKKVSNDSVDITVKAKEGSSVFANGKKIATLNSSQDTIVKIKLDGKDGSKSIKIEIKDKDGNLNKEFNLNVVKDTTPPEITLKGKDLIKIKKGSSYIEPGYSVKDNIDKNISVELENNIDINQVGKYIIFYTARDSAQNVTEKTRTIIVEDDYIKYNNGLNTLNFNDFEDVSIDLQKYFSSVKNDNLSFSVSGLPAGLKLENGYIKGKLNKNASIYSPYKLKVLIKDNSGHFIETYSKMFITNLPPKAKSDSKDINKNKEVSLYVLSNDTDPNLDTIKIDSIVQNPLHGIVKILQDKILYTPNNGYIGSDKFTYKIVDSKGLSSTAEVSINIKDNKNLPIIYLSQDTWDRDNYTLIAAAKKLHTIELIDLRSIDVTGKDTGNKGSDIFRAILGSDVDIPVLVNHSFVGRPTPTSSRFPNLARYTNIVGDKDTLDSTEYILSDLEGIDSKKDVSYVVGGHLHNFASLLLMDPNLVNKKVDRVVISTGWDSRTAGRPEMNLSEGVRHETSTSKATRIVFEKFKGEIVMASDPYSNYPTLNIDKMDKSSSLWYLIQHGKYNDKTLHTGDFEALLYGTVKTKWYTAQWTNKKSARCGVTKYGAVKITPSGRACSYLYKTNSYYIKAVLEELLYRPY